jgi:hypothetical protein
MALSNVSVLGDAHLAADKLTVCCPGLKFVKLASTWPSEPPPGVTLRGLPSRVRVMFIPSVKLP